MTTLLKKLVLPYSGGSATVLCTFRCSADLYFTVLHDSNLLLPRIHAASLLQDEVHFVLQNKVFFVLCY